MTGAIKMENVDTDIVVSAAGSESNNSTPATSVGMGQTDNRLSPSQQQQQHHQHQQQQQQQRPHTIEYLAQLLKDKKQLLAFAHIFAHVDRLVDEEINKVRASLFTIECNREALLLPEAQGPVITMQEKVYVPVNEYPEFNFVGRILGPRGMTAKQLEQETGCKIMVRGKGSMRDKSKEDQNRGKPNWEHLNDDLHVLIQCEDTENRALPKIRRAVEEIKRLLVPAPEGEDELKRKQLMELALINGTYRPANHKAAMQNPRLLNSFQLTSPLRSSALGHSIILSPTRISAPGATGPSLANVSSLIASSAANDLAAAAAAGLLYNPLDPAICAAAAAAGYPYTVASPIMPTEFSAFDQQAAGAILSHRRTTAASRDHPYKKSSLKSPHA